MFEHAAWKLKGTCAEEYTDIDVFFPPDNVHSSAQLKILETAAKEYCNQCPVSGNCLDEALLNDEYGVWGGTTRRERIRLRRRTSRVFCTRCRSRNIWRSPDGDGEICLFCGLSWSS